VYGSRFVNCTRNWLGEKHQAIDEAALALAPGRYQVPFITSFKHNMKEQHHENMP